MADAIPTTPTEPPSVLRPLDAQALAQARALLRDARHAALAVSEPHTRWPLASRVSVACDADGAPLILISGLSAHCGALAADARCSLLLGEPGSGDPLAHPRLTLLGLARRVPHGPARDAVRERFLAVHPKAALYADFGDFAFWRIEPQRASLNAGFGKAYALSGDQLLD